MGARNATLRCVMFSLSFFSLSVLTDDVISHWSLFFYFPFFSPLLIIMIIIL